MTAITIRFTETVNSLVKEEAKKQGISINQAVNNLVKKALGITQKQERWDEFEEFYGVWTKKEAEEFDRIIEENFEQIDEEMWK